MTEEFTHHILRMVVGRVCQPLGVHGMHQSVCDCMADVLKHYLLTLGRTTASYSSHGKKVIHCMVQPSTMFTMAA